MAFFPYEKRLKFLFPAITVYTLPVILQGMKCLFSIAGLLLILLWSTNHATAGSLHKFIPQSDSARFTDTINWYNLDFPGFVINEDDTIIFTTNGSFQTAVLDANIQVIGLCIVDTGCFFIIMDSLALGGPGLLTFGEEAIVTKPGSECLLKGHIYSYARGISSAGKWHIEGELIARPYDANWMNGLAIINFEDSVLVIGRVGMQAILSAEMIVVDTTGQWNFSSNYDYNGHATFDMLINYGSFQHQSAPFTATSVYNAGNMLISGTVHIENGEFINTGNCTWRRLIFFPINRLVNSNFQNFGSFTNFNILEIVAGSFSNQGTLNIIPTDGY